MTTALLGAVPFAAAMYFSVKVWRQRKFLRSQHRVGIVLVFASLAMLSSMATGRYHFGLPWALSTFHYAAMIVPMFVGLTLLLFSSFVELQVDQSRVRAVPLMLVAFLLTSIVTSLAYAREDGREVVLQRSLAKRADCDASSSPYLRHALSQVDEEILDLVDRNMGVLHPLCNQPLPAWVEQTVDFPALFNRMVSADPSSEIPLRDLWEVYISHFDLIRAFGVSDDKSAGQLLEFAHSDATSGSHYEPEKLAPHATYFSSINPSLVLGIDAK